MDQPQLDYVKLKFLSFLSPFHMLKSSVCFLGERIAGYSDYIVFVVLNYAYSEFGS